MEGHEKLGSLTAKFSKLLLTSQFAAATGGTFFDWRDLDFAWFSGRALRIVETVQQRRLPSVTCNSAMGLYKSDHVALFAPIPQNAYLPSMPCQGLRQNANFVPLLSSLTRPLLLHRLSLAFSLSVIVGF